MRRLPNEVGQNKKPAERACDIYRNLIRRINIIRVAGSNRVSATKHESNAMSDIACPKCGLGTVVEGTAGFSGDEGWVTSFRPKGLRLLTFWKSVNLNDGQLLRACTSCGHVWSSLDPAELRELLLRNGKSEK